MSKIRKRQRITKKKPVHQEFQRNCPYCNSIDVILDSKEGNVTCRSCGRVLSIHELDRERGFLEVKNDKGAVSKGRVGGMYDPLLASLGLGTDIVGRGGRELNKTQRKNMKTKELNLKTAFKKIQRICAKIKLNQKQIVRTKELYKNLWEKNLIKGKKAEIFYASCIYAGCRLEGSARTVNEICAATNVMKTDLTRCFSSIVKNLKLSKDLQSKKNLATRGQIVRRHCNYLKLSNYVTAAIEFACNKLDDYSRKGSIVEFQGKNPDTISSGIILFVTSLSSEKKTAADISEITGKAAVTISDMSRKIAKYKKFLLPKKFLEEVEKKNGVKK